MDIMEWKGREHMRFRQVHLDFHTSEAIAPIGARFDKKQFQEMLKLGHVDSVYGGS